MLFHFQLSKITQRIGCKGITLAVPFVDRRFGIHLDGETVGRMNRLSEPTPVLQRSGAVRNSRMMTAACKANSELADGERASLWRRMLVGQCDTQNRQSFRRPKFHGIEGRCSLGSTGYVASDARHRLQVPLTRPFFETSVEENTATVQDTILRPSAKVRLKNNGLIVKSLTMLYATGFTSVVFRLLH